MKRRSDYAIGYGRPPINTRFKPGQSGNPKGRVKGRKNMVGLLQDALDKRITVREGDTVRKVSTAEALILALMSKALKGDARACAMLIGLTQQSGEFESTPQMVTSITRVIVGPDGREQDY
jgi:hypothetical protein